MNSLKQQRMLLNQEEQVVEARIDELKTEYLGSQNS